MRPEPSATGLAMLERLPTFLWTAPEIAYTLDALGREIERIDAATAVLVDNFFPHKGEAYLHWWERLLGLSVLPPDKTLAQRRTTILAFLAALRTGGTATAWVEGINRLIGTNWTYEEHNPADAGSPPPYTIRITLPFTQPLADPTVAPVVSPAAAGSGAAAAYAYTALSAYGETPVSPTAAGTQGKDLSWAATPNATGYRIYRGTTASDLKRIGESTAAAFSDADGPTNLFTNPSAEVNATDGGITAANATIARSTAQAFSGVASFALTAVAAGNMSIRHLSSRVPVTPGVTYSAGAYFRAATIGRDCRVYIDWYDSTGVRVGAVTPGPIVADTTTGWVRPSRLDAVAPATAVTAQIIAEVSAAAAAEVHYVDALMIVVGSLPTYFDGATAGYVWAGAAHASVSRKPLLALTAGPPTSNSTRSPQTYEAEVLIRAITPAHIDLLTGYDEGFLVGISQVGEEFL